MHSIGEYMRRMAFGARNTSSPTGNAVDRRPDGRLMDDGWSQRPAMSAGTAREVLADRDMRKAGKTGRKGSLPKQYQSKDSGPDPRDTPKYGVQGTRPYSTRSKHGTGRGSQA